MDVSSGAGVAVLLTGFHDNPDLTCTVGDSNDTDSTIKGKKNESNNNYLDGCDGIRILDLCCSPGLKLLQIADFFQQNSSASSSDDSHKKNPVKVIGVDICKHRLNVCKSIVHKYFIDFETSGVVTRSKEAMADVNIQLYQEDGTLFGVKGPHNISSAGDASRSNSNNLIFDSSVAIEEMVQRGGKRKRMNKSARAREKKRLRQIASFERDSMVKEGVGVHNVNTCKKEESRDKFEYFNYVLVDAECSTDGSFKHIKERIKESACNKPMEDGKYREQNTRLTDPKKLAELVDLQRNLIASGFRLLKDGGTLVYSTCSLSEDQNEKVVKWLLDSNKDAVLVHIHFPEVKNTKFVAEGSLVGTVRFYPNFIQDNDSPSLLLGDGFYVAKIRKRVK